jgi:hypothetical protein
LQAHTYLSITQKQSIIFQYLSKSVMYRTSKRIIAFILLSAQLLTTTSCSGNFNIPIEPEIAYEHKKLDKKPSQADALVPLVNKEVAVDESLPNQLGSNREASVVPTPVRANKNQSLVSSHAKTAPRIVRSTVHSIKPTRNRAEGIDFGRNQVRGKQIQAQELGNVALTVTTPTVEQTVIEHGLIAKGGHKIQLKKQGNSWIAIVQENTLQGFSRTLYVDVYLAPNFTINGLSKHSLAWQGAHTTVIFPEKSSKGKGYVYIGEGGLLGGGKQQGCHYGPKDRRRDPDNPSRWVCPGPGKHPRTPPPSAPSSSSSNSSSSRPPAPSSSSSSSSRPSTPSSSSFRSSSSTTPSFGPFNPSFGPFRTSSSFSTHQPAKPTYQEQEEEQEAVRRAEDFDRWSRQSDYQWECRKHNHVYESKIETIKDQIFNQSKEIIARSGSYTYTVGLFDKEKFNKSKEIIREIEDFKTTIRDAICKIEKLEQNFRGEDIKRKNKVMRPGGKVVTYCTKDLYKLYKLEEQMDDLLDKVRDNSGPMRYGMNGETEYSSLYKKKKEVVHITDDDIRAINKELEESLKRIRRIIEEETKSTLIIEECYDIRRKLHGLIQRVKTFELDQKALRTLKNLEELDQEFEQRIKEEKHKIFVKTVSEEVEQERDQVKQVIESNSDICIILDAASRFKVRVDEVRVALMKGRLKDYKFKPEEILAIFDDSIKKINQAISEQKEKAIKDATTSQEKSQVEKNIKDQIERIEKKNRETDRNN